MFKTTALNSVANAYVDKDDPTSTPGTRLEADDRNITQDELVNAVEGLFLALDATGTLRNQLLTAISPVYTALKDYPIGWVAQGSDGIEYKAYTPNGPSSSIVNPVGDSTGVWRPRIQDFLRVSRSRFEFNSTSIIDIIGGAYAHYGTINQILKIDTTISHTITAPGTSQFQYIYADDSAIVSAGNNVLTASEIINLTTAPTYSITKNGWYNGDDLCIFAVYIDGSGNIDEFTHSGEFIIYWSPIQAFSASINKDTDTVITLSIPGFTKMCVAAFAATAASGLDGEFYWRVHESAGTNIALFRIDGNGYVQGIVMTDDSQQIYIRQETGSNLTATVDLVGWYFPVGM